MRLRRNDRGAALVAAIVILLVITLFSAALVTAAYRTRAGSTNRSAGFAARELAASVSDAVGEQITGVVYDSAAQQLAAQEAGQDGLWFYLRYQIDQGTVWPYYAPTEQGHGAEAGERYFTPEETSGDEPVLVTLRWEQGEQIVLTVSVRAEAGRESCRTTRRYVLERSVYADGAAEEITCTDASVNPKHCAIRADERWRWTREQKADGDEA